VLFIAKALIVVAFELEELLEVGLAIVDPLHGRKITEREHVVAVGAAETRLVENHIIGYNWEDRKRGGGGLDPNREEEEEEKRRKVKLNETKQEEMAR